MRERQAAARHIGVLSKTRREELMLEQEKAVEREMKKKKPVDKKNPWGGVAEDWALESRGKVGTDFDDFLASYTRDRRRDWDNPGEEVRISPKVKTGGIRDRLGWGPAREERRDKEEDLEWSTKMKRPRMGMVADLVEKETVRTPLRRKLPHRYDDLEEEEEEEDYPDLRQRVRVEDRVVRTASRRLGDRFRGGRLEGRLGLSHEDEEEDTGRRSRLGSRLGARARRGVRSDQDSGDSLERDNGEDLDGNMMVNNMVIRVSRGEERDREDRMQVEEDGREEEGRRRGEKSKNNEEREKEIRQRLREIQREKERIEERKQKSELSKSSRKDKYSDREAEAKRKERSKKLERLKSSKRDESDESETESSESEDSDSDSESSEESSDSSESESESEDSSSDSEEERRRRRDRERSSASRHKQRSNRDKDKKYHKEKKSPSSKSSRREKQEDSKKAAELRDQLRNYLKKAKEAKEKKKK